MLKKHYKKINYQGPKNLKPKKYFEGWYYKQVNEDEQHTISFIPGVSLNVENPHCFIQCIHRDPVEGLKATYFQYDLQEFSSSQEPFEIRIGDNLFSESHLKVDLRNDHTTICAEFFYGPLQTITRSPIVPNIMGFFSFIPNMECNHEVISMDHRAEGQLRINGESIEWGSGKGYIEKDWGKSFPTDYLWLQSNHFDKEGVSLICSVARIPFIGFAFKGFFCNVMVDGSEYRFATYNGARLRVVRKTKDYFDLIFVRKGLRLRLKGKINQSEELISPLEGKMIAIIKEGLSGEIKIVMKDRDQQVIVQSKSLCCGIELEV